MSGSIIAGRRLVAVAAALLVAAFSSAHGHDGEDMAPGLARLTRLAADGGMTVTILARSWSGAWRRAELRELPLLRTHWRGTRQSLEARRERLAVAQLRAADGSSLRCELLDDPAAPSGVCEEDGARLYFLVGPGR